jgi:hypothetical protein
MTGINRLHAAGVFLALTSSLTCVAPACAAALDLYYERALMSAADGKCHLFAPDTAAALAAGAAQARGAAVRSGAGEAALAATRQAALVKAASVACSSADLKLAASRVRAAFKGYGQLQRMDFPGQKAGWTADRSLPSQTPVWRLVQNGSLGPDVLAFGLAGRWGDPQTLLAVAGADGAGEPYAARLLVRDPNRAPEPYLDQIRAGSTAALPLSARTPPSSDSRVFEAEARSEAAPSLAPGGASRTVAFRFPEAAIAAIAALDPREAITVEFLYAGQGRDVVRKGYVEVGDFAAGLAFLRAAGR